MLSKWQIIGVHIVAFDISVTINNYDVFIPLRTLFENFLRTRFAMAMRVNQSTYYFHLWLNLTEISLKNNSQMGEWCNMHIPMKNVKCQYLSKRIFQQHNVLGKWNISILEIAIGDSNEHVLAYGQLDSV